MKHTDISEIFKNSDLLETASHGLRLGENLTRFQKHGVYRA